MFRKRKEKFVKISEDLFVHMMEVRAELQSYRDTEMKPDEVHMMSERLSEFEKAGLEPDDVIKLAERFKAKYVEAKGDRDIIFCPECGNIVACSSKYVEKNPFCGKCGQAIKVHKEGEEDYAEELCDLPESS